jgi:hypothetical protein
MGRDAFGSARPMAHSTGPQGHAGRVRFRIRILHQKSTAGSAGYPRCRRFDFRNGSHCRCLVGRRLFGAPVICAGMKRCGNPVIQEFRRTETRYFGFIASRSTKNIRTNLPSPRTSPRTRKAKYGMSTSRMIR